MAITINDIAKIAGVSRGTVDRVLHGRGRVSHDVEKRIMTIVSELDYKPSRAAQQLSMQKRKNTIGFISRTDARGMWANLLRGADIATKEFSDYGVTIKSRYFDQFLPRSSSQ